MKKSTEKVEQEIVKGKVGNALTSAAMNHIIATTDDIYDEKLSKYQDKINEELTEDINDIQTEVTILQHDLSVLDNEVSGINGKIPEEATPDNQLADKQYVQDAISGQIPTDYLKVGKNNIQNDVVIIGTKEETMGENTNRLTFKKDGSFSTIETHADSGGTMDYQTKVNISADNVTFEKNNLLNSADKAKLQVANKKITLSAGSNVEIETTDGTFQVNKASGKGFNVNNKVFEVTKTNDIQAKTDKVSIKTISNSNTEVVNIKGSDMSMKLKLNKTEIVSSDGSKSMLKLDSNGLTCTGGNVTLKYNGDITAKANDIAINKYNDNSKIFSYSTSNNEAKLTANKFELNNSNGNYIISATDNQDGVQCNVNSFKVNEKDRNGEFKFTKEGLTCVANNSSGERSIIVRAEAGAEEGFAIKTRHNDETLTPLRIYEDNYENFVIMDLPEFTDSEATEARVVGTLNKRLISIPVPQGGGQVSTLSLSLYENLDDSLGLPVGYSIYHIGENGGSITNNFLMLFSNIQSDNKSLSLNFYKGDKMSGIGTEAYISSISSNNIITLNDENGSKICALQLTTVNSEDYLVSVENSSKIEENIISNKLYGGKFGFTSTGNSTIYLNNSTSPDIKYSLDNGVTWTQWDYSTINLSHGQTVFMKGNNPNGFSSGTSAYNRFVITGSVAAHGNIMYLLDETGELRDLSGMDYCFYQLFYTCYGLTTAPTLPATTLAPHCYRGMFIYCNALTSAPELPATELADYCYQGMFSNCRSLTTAPELPATELTEGCYQDMFSACYALTTTPTLPATTLADYCYRSMFSNCSELTTTPELPATELADYCYQGMFSACYALTTAPTLPATTLADYCYRGMFNYCSELTTAPELPATELADYCYYSMFSNCSKLATAPELPATELTEGCYQEMFTSCTSLTITPVLPATELVDYCYQSMFRGCSKLSYIRCLATNISSNSCTYNWVNNVALSGFFEKPDDMSDWASGISGIPNDWCSEISTYNPTLQLSNPNYITLMPNEDNTMIGVGKLSSKQSLYISKNTTDWMQIPKGTVISCHSGETIYMCGILSGNNTTSDFTNLLIIGGVEISGNLVALWNYSNITNVTLKQYCGYKLFSACSATLKMNDASIGDVTTTLSAYCYSYMFSDCQFLITTPELPATTLANYCYRYMFANCSSLTVAPELPATTLANYCYSDMFYKCTSLTSVPQNMLPATTLAQSCYSNMFYNCTSLTSVPQNMLPATTLANSCYNSMFNGCTSLTVAPELPATTLANYCYSDMFYKCTSLTVAPELPATTLANYCYQEMFRYCASLTTAPSVLPATELKDYCYSYMFHECTSLTNVPELPATTLANYCCQNMFAGCESITTAPELPATELKDYCYQYMFSNCSSLTTAPSILPSEIAVEHAYYGMFSNCSSLTTAPRLLLTTLVTYCCYEMFSNCTSLTSVPQNMLPATTLAEYCYNKMFKGCTSLTVVPELSATTLAARCYEYMFDGCTSLISVPILPATTLNSYCYNGMFHGCTSLTNVPQNMLPSTSMYYGCYSNMFENCTSLTVAPELPATSLAYYCYEAMFRGCSNLNYIKCLTSQISSYMNSTRYWVNGVQTNSGTFVKNPNIAERTWGRGDNGIPNGWTVQNNS